MTRNIYLVAAFLLGVGSVAAQTRAEIKYKTQNTLSPAQEYSSVSIQPRGGEPAFWEEDFAGAMNQPNGDVTTNIGTWVISGINGAIWKHGYSGSNGCYSGGPNPGFATAANGYLIYDADSANCTDPDSNPPLYADVALTGSITSPAIDLSAVPSVLLEFSHASRWCCSATPPLFLAVSGDGGQSWSAEIAVPAPEINDAQPATTVSFNVSNIIGNVADARIRFTWTDESAYYWAIDDIRLVLPLENELILDYAFISHNSTSEEYGRVPAGQLLPEMLFGGMVRNFGFADQVNLEFNVNVVNTDNDTVLTGSEPLGMLSSPDTVMMEMLLETGPLTAGRYTATFEVMSTGDGSSGSNFANNTAIRRFEVTDSIFSIDGIGVHVSSQQEVGSLGNMSFENATTDFMMMSYYDLAAPMQVAGIEILFASGTQADGSIFVSLHDTADISADIVNNPIAESDIYDIPQNGATTKRVYFESPVALEPGAYYAAVRMVSTDKEINIRDDLSVPQPFYSSMIYHSGDETVYSNGNAFAIRLLGATYTGIDEHISTFAGFNAYPNPTGEGMVTLNLEADRAGSVTLRVMTMQGAEVVSSSFNVVPGSNRQQLSMDSFSNGLYFVQVSGNDNQSTLKLMVNR